MHKETPLPKLIWHFLQKLPKLRWSGGEGPLLKLILKLFKGETSCPICGQEGGGVWGLIWAVPEREGLFLGFLPLHLQILSVPWTICSSRKNFVCDISESETEQCSNNAKVSIYKWNAEMKCQFRVCNIALIQKEKKSKSIFLSPGRKGDEKCGTYYEVRKMDGQLL